MGIPGGLRLSFGLLSVVPVRYSRAGRAEFGAAMRWAPVVGLAVGVVQGAVFWGLDALGAGGLVAAVLAVGLGAALTRGLHWDGLADVADGLGSGRPAETALEIMKKSDIGPFGVLALVFTALVQVAAVASLAEPALALVVAAVAGRVAIVRACALDVPAARPDGLGSMVAGTVPRGPGTVLTALLLGGAGLAALAWTGSPRAALPYALAPLAGLLLAGLFRRHLVRRFGGITGDVLGALCEGTVAVCLVALTLGR
ncbi:adenosylcobinamide-GDP ribazoletransferase [Actinocorallia sp. API 0066]|uniref:adenosylcobinamide-GDP ribazoletransferase n=1 Tax=Actinocorallia sp. API 0066 TaxID=2896846 RepID=UPI001E5ACD0B|nr:adenosylcobinamide-GDP ribazoletransferase [Actinocorallia sp. API 0066]MCD0451011.1 adenosylcobinamide-GDP ribazoletransferase [Actinocorallia sp. API 0066]